MTHKWIHPKKNWRSDKCNVSDTKLGNCPQLHNWSHAWKNRYLRPLLPWALGHLQLWAGTRGAESETVKAKHTPVRNGIASDINDYVTDLAWSFDLTLYLCWHRLCCIFSFWGLNKKQKREKEKYLQLWFVQPQLCGGVGMVQWLECWLRIWVPAGAVGKFSSLWSTFCAHSYFSICSTTIIPP